MTNLGIANLLSTFVVVCNNYTNLFRKGKNVTNNEFIITTKQIFVSNTNEKAHQFIYKFSSSCKKKKHFLSKEIQQFQNEHY